MSQSNPTTKETTRIVVLGSGYGGVHAVGQLAKNLKEEENVEVVLISDTDHLLYVTMLYEVVAGNLAPSSIRQSVRTMVSPPELQFMQGQVEKVDFDKQIINYSRSKKGDNKKLTLSYDYLISAIGSETNYFNTPGAEEYAYPVKTLQDATRLKNRLIHHFEQATLLEDEKEQLRLLSVVVVGGGATGVTLAAKIADLFNNELRKAFPQLISLANITIIEAGNQLMGNLGSWFSSGAMRALNEKQCVSIRLNERALELTEDGVTTSDNFFPSQLVIWTAGVKAREFAIQAEKPVDIEKKSRRVQVTEEFHLPHYKNVFVAGDQSWVKRPELGPYPMRAQFAVRQGKQAAENILRQLRGQQMEAFSWADKGVVVSTGDGGALAEVGGFRFSGWFATVAYKAIYLLSTVGIRAKLRAILEWGMNLFLPRDVSEL